MRGILNINKPKGLTSFDIIARLRKQLNIKKIGHAGTLDPIATGVLPIFVGNATRLIQYMPKTKSYRAFARLGLESQTYDTEGEIVSKKICTYDVEQIKFLLKTFEGKQLQMPPIYSAISVNGKRLYEYARKNEDVAIPWREVEIFNIEFIDFKEDTQFPLLTFDINCASGVYVRSIIHDLGQKLNSGAMMENLIRTMSANLKIENSINYEKVNVNNVSDFFIEPASMIEFPPIILNDRALEKIKMGQFLSCEKDFQNNDLLKLIHNNSLVGIGYYKDGKIKPKTVLN